MPRYASATEVSSDRSRQEIERTLRRYGATSFAYGWEEGSRAMIAFQFNGRHIRFLLPLPDVRDREFTATAAGRPRRSAAAIEEAYEQAIRQRWRALALCIKAKLEAVEAGISTFEDEFLAHIVLPNGKTAGEWLRPQVARAYETGKMPDLLALLGPDR